MVNVSLRALFNTLLLLSVLGNCAITQGLCADDPRLRVVELIKQGNYKGALDYQKNVLCPDKSDACAHRGLSNIYMGLNDSRKAADEARAATTAGPNDYMNFYNLAWVLQSVHNTSEALTAYQKAATLAPKKIDPQIGVVQCLLETGSVKEGIVAAEKLTKSFPKDPLAWTNLANAYFRGGKYAQTLGAVKTAQELNPDNSTGYQLIAMVKQAQNDPVGAKDAAAKWLDKEPKNPAAYNFLGAACYNTNDSDMARRVIEKGIASVPSDKQVFLTLGTGMAAKADATSAAVSKTVWYELAEMAMKQAVANDDTANNRLLYARILFKQRKYADALAQAKTVRDREPANGEAAQLCKQIASAQNDIAGQLRRWIFGQ